ncbi:hypothetical protein TELCIR_15959 [Teladorsagia circumcincta]|uniref:Uncharacterized protein n=1 Tax=Teladorsagia circumcincta TaxID=45464 RepID=A0A2G9TWT7_TELCI|nr:hypothetical protein TELCIR_15959 [Teladorsagia circumcincta]
MSQQQSTRSSFTAGSYYKQKALLCRSPLEGL